MDLQMDGFWVQTLSGIIAGVIASFLQPSSLRRLPTPPPPTSTHIEATAHGSGGALANGPDGRQAYVRDSPGAFVDQRVHNDNSRHTTIHNSSSAHRADDTDELIAFIAGALVAALVVVALFLFAWKPLRAISYGLALALVVRVVIAARRTTTVGGLGTRVWMFALLSGLVSVGQHFVWHNVATASHHSVTVPDLAQPWAAFQWSDGLAGWGDTFGAVLSSVQSTDDGFTFILQHAAACALTLLLLGGLLSLSTTWLRAQRRMAGISDKKTDVAYAFLTSGGFLWALTATALVAALLWGLSSGVLLRLMDQ